MGFFDFLKRKELQKISELEQQLQLYSKITDVEAEAAHRKIQRQSELNELDKLITDKRIQMERDEAALAADLKSRREEIERQIIIKQSDLDSLVKKYDESLTLYKKLRAEVGLYESKLDVIEYGIYTPVYDFERSDDYRLEQERIVNQQKNMIQNDNAAVCHTQWSVGGSEAQGRATVKRYKKLMLRAFNGECDALIAKVKWNNVMQMQERLSKLFEAINKLGENFQVEITTAYKLLKQKELVLEYEYQSKRQKEKEEMRAVQDELREEEKARREFEQAQRAAEKEEQVYQKALEKARREVEEATGSKQIKLQAQIEMLEQQLLMAQDQRQRAISMAQQTKRGHVYIISNIGSFGEDVYKIGMTRRLEPTDRVRELGDASVPFQFDIHAMIFCEDAPSLENALHRAFNNRKVNMLNYRKEFFHVTVDEIEAKLGEIGVNAEFTRLPEAMEYRETKAILEKLRLQQDTPAERDLVSAFPESLPDYVAADE